MDLVPVETCISSPPPPNSFCIPHFNSFFNSRPASSFLNVQLDTHNDLATAQIYLHNLKQRISAHSKKNFVLERDVWFLDEQIALLIQNRMHLDDKDANLLADALANHQSPTSDSSSGKVDQRKLSLYGYLFYLLQTDPTYIAVLCRHITLSEMDALIQTVMFTLYGNQYDAREEYLLLSMFHHVLAHQFESATVFGSVLRANTPVTRMMTTYTRRGPGQAYLKSVLGETIGILIRDKDLDLEIHPLRVYEQVYGEATTMDLDKVSEIPQVQSVIESRARKLMHFASMILRSIVDSLANVPYGVRWICKQIRGLAKRKFPHVSDAEICSMIAGFFFLRYVNPAIVTPQAYMLVPSRPSDHARRSLTLIAKLIQKLIASNRLIEPHMAPFQNWYATNTGLVRTFLTDLAHVNDFRHALELEQYFALSKRTLKLNITINEIYAMHRIVAKHASELCGKGSKLDRLILDLGVAPAPVPRSQSLMYTLTLISPGISATPRTSPDAEAMYVEVKTEFIEILRRVPGLIPENKAKLDLRAVARCIFETHSQNSSIVEMTRLAMAKLAKLEALHVVSADDGYKVLVEEVADELVDVVQLCAQLNNEIRCLESVFQVICEHNVFLLTQLDSYKAYLANVNKQQIHVKEPSRSPGNGSHSPIMNWNGLLFRSRN